MTDEIDTRREALLERGVIVDFEKATIFNFERELLATLPDLRPKARTFASRYFDADDLINETAAKALQYRDSFVPGTNMRAWLHLIMRNHVLSSLRRTNRRESELSPEQSDYVTANLAVGANAEIVIQLRELLAGTKYITPSRHRAFELVVLQEHSYEEAAIMLNLSVGTVKSRVSRARAELFAFMGIERGGDDERTDGGQPTPGL